MTCKCGSTTHLNFQAKCNDLSVTTLIESGDEVAEKEGYVPHDLGLGGGDYVRLNVCTSCGQLQGWTPLEVDRVKEILENR